MNQLTNFFGEHFVTELPEAHLQDRIVVVHKWPNCTLLGLGPWPHKVTDFRFDSSQYDVEFVLDDRDRVVKMWRDRGLKVLQVAEGDF